MNAEERYRAEAHQLTEERDKALADLQQERAKYDGLLFVEAELQSEIIRRDNEIEDWRKEAQFKEDERVKLQAALEIKGDALRECQNSMSRRNTEVERLRAALERHHENDFIVRDGVCAVCKEKA